jgi:nitric oxide reductase activation protein
MEGNFYIFREKRERSVATALVLDMSASTRQKVQEASIFQHQKYAAYVLAEALDAVGDRFGIYSFYDFGPPATLFFPIKELEERWSARHVDMLRRFQPATRGWSRFSVGVRHLIRKLRDAREKSRIIFFITDGLPSYYEGPTGRTEEAMEYQVDGRNFQSSTPLQVMEVIEMPLGYVQADLRKVREEAALSGVHLFCITLEESSVPFMEQTFGSAFIYLPDVSQLAPRLAKVFQTITS